MTVIAIDGPSSSGKSTLARLLAERLRIAYLDTGAMYRSVALVAKKRDVGFDDVDGLVKIASEMKFQLIEDRSYGGLLVTIMLNGVDETSTLRTPEISDAASRIAVLPSVRERLVRRQQLWAEDHESVVVEGRDIGTVVFPRADLKIFLTASSGERAKRRGIDAGAAEYSSMHGDAVAEDLATRDERDVGRTVAPLEAAPDAVVIDSTGTDIEDVYMQVIAALKVRNRGELPKDLAK